MSLLGSDGVASHDVISRWRCCRHLMLLMLSDVVAKCDDIVARWCRYYVIISLLGDDDVHAEPSMHLYHCWYFYKLWFDFTGKLCGNCRASVTEKIVFLWGGEVLNWDGFMWAVWEDLNLFVSLNCHKGEQIKYNVT